MVPSKKAATKSLTKDSRARRQTQAQLALARRSQKIRNVPLRSFRCFFCLGEKPPEEQMPSRTLPICTNCHEHFTIFVSQRAHPAAPTYTPYPLPSSPPPPPTPLPCPTTQRGRFPKDHRFLDHEEVIPSPLRPAVVIDPSKGLKKKIMLRLRAPKKPDAIDPSKKKIRLRLTAPKKPKPILFLSLSKGVKILLTFPNPLRKKD